MQVRKESDLLLVGLTSEEVTALQDGRMLGTRGGATFHDAKVEVLPLSAIDPDDNEGDRYSDDRLERGLKASLRAHLDSAGDLRVFVPAAKLTDTRIAGAILTRDQVEFMGADESRDPMISLLPEKGIALAFGGSLKRIDIMAEYLEDLD